MDSWREAALQSPIDLSSVLVTEPGPRLLTITTRMTTVRGLAAARAFAQKLAGTLGWSVQDEVEDDGVTRLPQGSTEEIEK